MTEQLKRESKKSSAFFECLNWLHLHHVDPFHPVGSWVYDRQGRIVNVRLEGLGLWVICIRPYKPDHDLGAGPGMLVQIKFKEKPTSHD